jgi:hypothetical protein
MFRWELEDLAEEQLASLPPRVTPMLTAFMDAVVLVDPMEYQRRADEPSDPARPVRRLPFGPSGEGLVTFLVHAPDELVLVLRIHWLGE